MGSTANPRPLDLSHDVHLSGVFAPMDDEVDHDDLEVEGTIPPDLVGAYLHNGPNPKFPPLGSEFDTVVRYDLETGAVASHTFTGAVFGEAVFAPRGGGDDENEGYVVTFVTDLATKRSSFVILDAAAMDAEPVATIRLPVRVPQGLHGTWFPAGG